MLHLYVHPLIGTDDFRPNQFNIWSPGHGFPPAGYGHDTSDMSEKEKIKKSKDKNKDNSDAEQPDGYRGSCTQVDVFDELSLYPR